MKPSSPSRILAVIASLTLIGSANHLMGDTPATQDGPSSCANKEDGGVTVPCGKPGCETDEKKAPKACGSDPIDGQSGDFQRNVTDLEVWGGVGGHALSFQRLCHTRTTGGKHWFGSSNDRHNYQWEMADAGVDSQGRARVRIYYPEGDTYLFTRISPTVWSPQASVADTMTQSGNELFLKRQGGMVFRFQKFQNTGGAWYYQMTDFKDTKGNTYLFEYDAGDPAKLIKVTEPGGRSVRISYGVQTISASTRLATINSIPANNAWTTLTLANPGSFRHVWYRSADGGFGMVAELEFYDGTTKHTGASFGTLPVWDNDPIYSPDKAFDGNTGTFYHASTAMITGAVAGLDLGTAKNITAVRFFPRIGVPHAMYANVAASFGFSFKTTGEFWGSNDAPVTVDVISAVASHDAAGNEVHTVNYTYSNFDDQSLPGQKYAVLSSVNYEDASSATFTYHQLYPGTVPLVAQYTEPRYDQPLVRAKLLYKTGMAAVLGAIWQQRNPDTDTPIATWGAENGSLHVGKLWFANGGTETFAVNGQSLTSHKDALGQTTTYAYSGSGAGYLNKLTDSAGRVTQWTRDANHNVLTETYQDGKTRVYTRDSLGLVLTEKDENNRTTTYTRDANHRVTLITHPDGLTESFTYNSFGQVLTHTRRDGTTVSNVYDATGLKTNSTDALGKVTTYTYDAAGRPATVTDPLNRTTTFSYNNRGQVTQTILPDTTTRSATYDVYGSLLTSTDEQGHTTTRTYDWYKRPVTMKDALNRTTTYDYTLAGGGCGCGYLEDKPITITSPAGRVTFFTYDLMWRKTSVTTGFGTTAAATTNYTYNQVGHLHTVTDPLNHTTTYIFNSRDWKHSETNPLNQTTSYTYDGVGNLLTTTLPDGRVTTNTYDVMDRLATTKDPLNQIITYEYDAMDRMKRLIDTKSNVTTWNYDTRGSLIGKVYATGDTHAYTYDDVARLTTHTTPNGDICTYSYDSRDRLLVSDWNTTTPDTTRTYNPCGQLLTIDNTVSLNTYVYDAGHQLTSETHKLASETTGKTVAYTYDPDGNRASTTYPSGQVVELAWTPRNQLAAVTADGPPPLASYTYDLAGRNTAIAHENGVSEVKSYDNADRLLSNQHLKNGSPLSGHSYSLDTTGRRTGETFADGSTPARSYGYDPTDQVTSADYGNAQTDAYDYDSMGNRESVTFSRSVGVPPTSGTVTYTTNSANQYTAISNQPPPPTYDANGNLLTQNGVTYTWDSENRLLSLSDGTTTVTHTYDALHRRVTKTANGTTTRFVYDGWNVIEEFSGTTLAKSLTWGADLSGSLQAAGGVGGLLLTLNHSALITSHFHYDGNGNITQLTDAAGTTTASYRYDAFGNTLAATGSAASENNYRFSTKPVDEEIAASPLHYYGYRYYIAPLGRWLNRDPIEEQGGINLYGFVRNDGIGKWDNLGLLCNCHYECWSGLGKTGTKVKGSESAECCVEAEERIAELYQLGSGWRCSVECE
ncbi:MAG: RHS repeat-associated core domain-containing protein [Verrucomicrobiota bacterium]